MKKKILKRNKIVYSEKNEEEIIPLLLDNYEKGNKTIFIGNTINSVNAIFEKLGNIQEKYALTTRLIPSERLKIINKIKNSDSTYVLASTQIIEAGVDVDADYIIRDLAPMDSIIQAAGRVNRNNKKETTEEILISILKTKNGKFLSNYIYDTSEIDRTKTILKTKKILQEKEYEEIIANYYDKLSKEIEYFSIARLLDYSQDLIGTRVLKEIKLIENNNLLDISIYVSLNKESKNLLEKYSEILKEYSENKNLDGFLKKDAEWSKIKPDFLKNIVNIKMRCEEELKLNKIGSFYVIDHVGQDNNEYIYYDENYGVVISKTGNKDISTSEIW
jgi:CRISPR-associated endonuclease/helicase Cas3